jgi:Rps23 Pro-64 3,4-dihydroxylase Tpa1-like proline 4-hydroxylase
MKLEIEPHHNAKSYAKIYAANKRLHIPDLFNQNDAIELFNALTTKTIWNTVLNSGEKVYELTPDILETMTTRQIEDIQSAVISSAQTKYQYEYCTHRMSNSGEPYSDPAHPLAKVVEFLNSSKFLEFVRTLTGKTAIDFSDAQATRYGSGHFLHTHDDIDIGKKRQLAYVLNMTPNWLPEWGGILNFLDDDGHIAEGYTPKFNAINIFDVRQKHFVSYVAPFAAIPRISITGWIRSR